MVDIQTYQIETELVPGPIQYDILLPKRYQELDIRFPLMLFLHGGGPRDHQHLKNTGPRIWNMWEKEQIPEMVVVTPLCKRSMYMNYRDGSQKWESFIINDLLPHLQEKFRVYKDKENTFIGGISMGGTGPVYYLFTADTGINCRRYCSLLA